MTRKEEIIYAALELASEQGLAAVTLSQIAERVGIRKPSLYNHFSSKEELVQAMYTQLRETARAANGVPPADPAALFSGRTLEEILLFTLTQYMRFISDTDMLRFFRVLYSERSTSPAAAQIMLEETERMLQTVRSLFYALTVHGKMKNRSVDAAALSYAMTVHSLVDRQMDMMTAGRLDESKISDISDDLRAYVKWFAEIMEADDNE